MSPTVRTCAYAFLCLFYVKFSLGHVSLTFPPARKYDLDFLDTFRTKPPCGMPKGEVITSLPAGATFNVTWHLGYPHRGGYKLELLDSEGTLVSTLTPSTPVREFTGQNDVTKQSQTISLPKDIKCTDCTIRLVRQALEWGASYKFVSCGDIQIVPAAQFVGTCSGHGTLKGGRCQCEKLHSGLICQYKDECWGHSDCGKHGRCINIEATTYPKNQCFCEPGWFGEKCSKESSVRSPNVDLKKYTEKKLSNELTLYWRILKDIGEIEAVLKAKSTTYVALGWRPQSLTASCKAFPYIRDDGPNAKAEPEPKPESEPEPEPKSEPEPKTRDPSYTRKLDVDDYSAVVKNWYTPKKNGPDSENESKLTSEPEPGSKAEPKSEPEPGSKAEPKSEPEPGSKAEPKSEPEPGSKAEPKSEPEPGSKAEPKSEPEPGSKAEPKSEPEPGSKAELKSEPEPGSNAEPKSEPEPGSKAEPKSDPEPGSKAEPKSEPEPSSKAEPKSEPEPGSKAEPKSEPEPSSKAEPKSEPEPGSKAEPARASSRFKREGSANAEPEPNSEPEPHAESAAEPEPAGDAAKTRGDYTPRGDFHAMDCTDIVIGTASGNLGRVFDYYTRDRSTPAKDSFYGGTDGLTAALADERDGQTTIIFRKKLKATEQSDHSIEQGLMNVIWARGQEPGLYNHNPKTGIDTGRASVPDFYRRDELKYHGHGNQRGKVTMNFYDEKAEEVNADDSAGSGEWKTPNNCHGKNCEYRATWKYQPETDEIFFSISTNHSNKWTGIGFSKDTAMANSDAIIGWIDESGKSVVLDTWLSGYRSPIKDESQDIYNIAGSSSGGVTTLEFVRKRSTFDSSQDLHFSDEQCLYMMYPVRGAPYDTRSQQIQRHENTPVLSSNPVCIKGKGSAKPAPSRPTTLIQTIPVTETSTFTDLPASPASSHPTYYKVSMKLADIPWKAELADANSEDYGALANLVSESVDNELKNIPGYKPVIITGFSSNDNVEIIAQMKVATDDEASIEQIESTLKRKVRESKIGFLKLDISKFTMQKFFKSGEWKTPANCQGIRCEYRATWNYTPENDEILFSISTNHSNKWTGIGFSKDNSMANTDAVIGWVDESGRSFLMDTYLSGYGRPTLDSSQDIYNKRGLSSGGLVTIEFARKRSSLDTTQDHHFTEDQCLYLVYPVRGAAFNTVNKRIRKHEVTPVLSRHTICIGDFLPITVPKAEPEPKPEPSPTVGLDEVTPPTKAPNNYNTGSAANRPIYKLSLKITNVGWTSKLADRNSTEYSALKERIEQNVFNSLRDHSSFKAVEVTELSRKDDDVITEMNIFIDEVRGYQPELETALNTRVRAGYIGRLKVDPSYFNIDRADLPNDSTASAEVTTEISTNVTTAASTHPPFYKVSIKLADVPWTSNLGVKNSREYDTLEKKVAENVNEALNEIPGFKSVIVTGFSGNDQEVIAQMNLLIDEVIENGTNVNATLRTNVMQGRIGKVKVDPAHYIFLKLQSVPESENPGLKTLGKTEDTESDGRPTDSQIKTYVIIAGVSALVLLLILQASCVIAKERKKKNKTQKPSEKLVTSGWKDYSTTSSSNYSYENFGMTGDEPSSKVSKHPVGSAGPEAAREGRTRSRQDDQTPRNPRNGYSATVDRPHKQSSHPPSYTSVYATHDRSLRSANGSSKGQTVEQLQPDFYFMPSQRKYSGEVVRVYVDYNDPEYQEK